MKRYLTADNEHDRHLSNRCSEQVDNTLMCHSDYTHTIDINYTMTDSHTTTLSYTTT